MSFKLTIYLYLINIVLYLQTPCSENPCKNGATCIPMYDDDTFKCKCAAGYKGKKCDKGNTAWTFHLLIPYILPTWYWTLVFLKYKASLFIQDSSREINMQTNLQVLGVLEGPCLGHYVHHCEFRAKMPKLLAPLFCKYFDKGAVTQVNMPHEKQFTPKLLRGNGEPLGPIWFDWRRTDVCSLTQNITSPALRAKKHADSGRGEGWILFYDYEVRTT